MLDPNMKNIYRILEKTAEREPYEFGNTKGNTIALIWQVLSSILITKFWNMFEYHVLVCMKNKEHGNFNNVLFFMSLKHAHLWKKVLNAKIAPMRAEYLIQNMCRYDSYRVQSADTVLEKKEKLRVHLNISVICY